MDQYNTLESHHFPVSSGNGSFHTFTLSMCLFSDLDHFKDARLIQSLSLMPQLLVMLITPIVTQFKRVARSTLISGECMDLAHAAIP